MQGSDAMITATRAARAQRRPSVYWDATDWDRLAKETVELWAVYPERTIRWLANKTQESWLKDRRRNLSTLPDISPLTERVKVIAAKIVHTDGETPLSREQILASLDEQEIYERFAPVVLSRLIGGLAQLGSPKPIEVHAVAAAAPAIVEAAVIEQPKPRLARICFVGPLPRQEQRIRAALRGKVQCYFIPRDRKGTLGFIPTSYQHAVLMKDFIKHETANAAVAQLNADHCSFVSGTSIDNLCEVALAAAARYV